MWKWNTVCHAAAPHELSRFTPSAPRRSLARRAVEAFGADGVNLINSCGADAWQTVFHFHIHVIPRYKGDPLKLPWTPAPGDPAELAAAAELLR